MSIINAISIVNKTFNDIGKEVSLSIQKTGNKPDYIVVSSKQHDDMLSKDGNIKIKKGRVLKFKGMSVIVTP